MTNKRESLLHHVLCLDCCFYYISFTRHYLFCELKCYRPWITAIMRGIPPLSLKIIRAAGEKNVFSCRF